MLQGIQSKLTVQIATTAVKAAVDCSIGSPSRKATTTDSQTVLCGLQTGGELSAACFLDHLCLLCLSAARLAAETLRLQLRDLCVLRAGSSNKQQAPARLGAGVSEESAEGQPLVPAPRPS